MIIPNSFKVFDREITVEIVEDLVATSGALGLAMWDANKIKLQSVIEGICDCQTQEEIFFHELIHVLLDSIEEDKLSSNEKFVSLFSRVLKQALGGQNVQA